MIRPRLKLIIAVAVTALISCGCGSSTVASGSRAASSSTPSAPSNGSSAAATSVPPTQPDSHVAESTDILSVLSVEHQVDLAALRDGAVLSIAKDEGSAVKKGEVLGQLDDRDLQMELIKARDDLQVSQNNVKYKEAELKAKGAAYRRQQQLRNLGLSTQADLEAAEFEAKGAEYDLHGWEALAESGQAEIRRIELEIDQTRIRAAFSGVVVRRYIREGESVKKGDRCFRVSQLSPLQVQFQISESSPRRPQRGASVVLSLVDDANRVLTAKIVKISPTVDPSSDSFDVVAQLTGSGISDLRPGMAVRVNWPAAIPHPRP
jgi:RND family efflux transporter MFP subunit